MKRLFRLATLFVALTFTSIVSAADAPKDDEGYRPHTPTLIYYLSDLADEKDAETIVATVQKLPSVRKVNVNLARGYAQVRFDSHVVSYHQVGQAIADAGTKVGKKFEPRLKIRVPEYSQGENAGKVDAVLAGKRLNQRVRIEPIDKTKGEFFVYLLPLQLDPDMTGPQGFNGGHLNHPLHDPPPRGLGLTCIYAAEDDGIPASSKQETSPKPR
jgi:copper chaperone CopZ